MRKPMRLLRDPATTLVVLFDWLQVRSEIILVSDQTAPAN